LVTEIALDEPWPSVPVSKLCPSSAVTVCGALSSFRVDLVLPLGLGEEQLTEMLEAALPGRRA
jgi:hypothetical protein